MTDKLLGSLAGKTAQRGVGGKRTVALVGFRTAGKTSVGRALQEKFGWRWVDVDEEVERRSGTSVASIIRVEGEQRFRQLEHEALTALLELEPDVISLGGGALLREENKRELQKRAVVVHLEVGTETAIARMLADEEEALAEGKEPVRPLLGTGEEGDLEERIRRHVVELKKRRQGLYESAADLTIVTDGLSVEEVAQAVAAEREKMLLAF